MAREEWIPAPLMHACSADSGWMDAFRFLARVINTVIVRHKEHILSFCMFVVPKDCARKQPSSSYHRPFNLKSVVTMRKLSVVLVFAVAANGFVPTQFSVRRNVAGLFSTRPDTSEYVAAALEASKKFGSTSKEARLAWEQVEEMDSSDNR